METALMEGYGTKMYGNIMNRIENQFPNGKNYHF